MGTKPSPIAQQCLARTVHVQKPARWVALTHYGTVNCTGRLSQECLIRLYNTHLHTILCPYHIMFRKARLQPHVMHIEDFRFKNYVMFKLLVINLEYFILALHNEELRDLCLCGQGPF